MHRISLGLHLGHNASCALVVDGELRSAVQQERLSRKKHDGRAVLNSSIPISECVASAGLQMTDVTDIVICIQSAAPGGVGMHLPLIDDSFEAFSLQDPRLQFISHHLAHAVSSFGCSGFDNATVLVLDRAGSSTYDGLDFALGMEAFSARLSTQAALSELKTECMSIYRIDGNGPQLLEREFTKPHPAPEIFVDSVSSMYDNVARFVFGSENAHGQLMALASLTNGHQQSGQDSIVPLVVDKEDRVTFYNDWQALLQVSNDPLAHIGLAQCVQDALERACLAYARRAQHHDLSRNFTVAGGTFLNILVNSKIGASQLFDQYFFPSAPHDAGISVGCAFYGQSIWSSPNQLYRVNPVSDRLGPDCADQNPNAAVRLHSPFIKSIGKMKAVEIAKRLQNGAVIARCSGRSEFGPRALGGRSLLASPLLSSSKTRLNLIKERQDWRPVAPIIHASAVKKFLKGPTISPYMNFVHHIHTEHQDALPALYHPDSSTRAQTLDQKEDPFLHEIIGAFGDLTGYPILVNTSLNGRGEPILQTYEQAIHFFREKDDIDVLLLDDMAYERNLNPFLDEATTQRTIQVTPGTIVSTAYGAAGKRMFVVINHHRSLPLSRDIAVEFLELSSPVQLSDFLRRFNQNLKQGKEAVIRAFDLGMLEFCPSQ